MKKLASSTVFWPALALALLLLLNLVLSPHFFALEFKDGRLFGSLIDILLRASPLIVVSLGMTLVIATGGIDLSVGTVAALSAALSALGFAHGMGFFPAVALGLVGAIAVGGINAILISYFGLQPIIASLIAMVAGRGVAQLCVGGQIATLSDPTLTWIGTGSFLALPFAVPLAFGIFICAALLIRKTALGLFIEAVGCNAEASRLAGLPLRSIGFFIYIACSLGAALAGLLISANIRAVDVNNLGLYLELDAILAVVIGGTALSGGRFSLLGSVLGALIIQTVTTTINTQGVAVQLMLVVKAAVVIVICLLQSPKFRERLKKRPKPSTTREAA